MLAESRKCLTYSKAVFEYNKDSRTILEKKDCFFLI